MLHAIIHALGIDTQLSFFYAFYSGFGPFAVSVLTLALSIGTILFAVNCHVHGCLRIGKYPMVGGQFKVCRKHHSNPAVKNGLTVEHIHAAHEDFLGK
jgi:hypothetical protein